MFGATVRQHTTPSHPTGLLTPTPIIRPKLNHIRAPTIQRNRQRRRPRRIIIRCRDERHNMANTIHNHTRISLRTVCIRIVYPYRRCRRDTAGDIRED